jgi:hypothetical protein
VLQVVTFACPRGDGTCTTGDDVTVALLRGEIVVGGPRLLEALFPDGMDIAAVDAQPIEWSVDEVSLDEEGGQDVRLFAGQSIARFAPAAGLAQLSGVIAVCTPCKDRWIVPVPSHAGLSQ